MRDQMTKEEPGTWLMILVMAISAAAETGTPQGASNNPHFPTVLT
jgi:hypothetical protein